MCFEEKKIITSTPGAATYPYVRTCIARNTSPSASSPQISDSNLDAVAMCPNSSNAFCEKKKEK